MEQTTFWLTTSTNDAAGDGGNLSGATQQQNKEVELSSMLNQPTMMNFATIFAGASAAVASSGSTNMLARVPSLSQIGIPPSGHLAKQGQILAPISSLQAVPNINQMSLHPQSQPMTSAVTVNSLNNIQPLTTTIYTLPLPTDPIQIPKNFLQQAAAASGLTSTSGDSQNNTSIVIAPQRINPVNISATLPATPQIIQAATPQSSTQAVAVQQPSTAAPATYQCGECSKTFENSGQLSYHTFVTHAQLQARPHKCTACPESFLLDHHLRDHMRAIHLPPEQGGGAPFTCSECMASFDDGGHLNFHLYMAHTIQGAKPAQQQQFPCPECGKSFIKPALLSAHIRNVHCGQVYTLVAATPAPTVAVPEPKNFKCNDCGKAFKTASYLKQHNMSVHEKPLKCMLCQKGFGRKSELKRHMRGVHMRERPHVCSICGWTFAEIGNLKHHIQAVHQKDKPYRCMYCDKTFSLTSYLRTHLLRMHNIDPENLKGHEAMEVESSQQQQQQQPQQQQQQQQQQPAQLTLTSGEQNAQAAIVGLASSGSNTVAIQALQLSVAQTHLIRCYECGQVFQNPQLLQSHVLSSHTQPFWCTVCGEGFSLASQLTLHLQLRHSSDEHNNPNNNVQTVQAVALQAAGPVTIELPQSITPSQSQQQQQIITSQQNLTTTQQPQQQQQQSNTINIAPNKCPLCNTTYDTAPDKHVCTWKKQIESACATAMAIANERPHVCGECGKAFKTTTHLKQHIRCVHSKERPHQCTVCEKSFARTSDLNRHVKGVHQRMKMVRSSVFVTLKCSECGAIYTETSQLKRHIYTTHLRGRPSFKCADCQEGFSDEIAFQNHICHEVERPHVCSCCSKRFSMGAQLRRHMRAAHGRTSDEPMIHKCFQCNRNFGRPIDLERHIQAVHLKEKPHKCTLCGKSFGLQGNLNKHVRAVHLLEKPHQCIECGKRFAHVGVLKRHLRDIHFYDKKASVKQKLAQLQMEGRVMQNVQQPEEQQQQKTDNVVSQADSNLQQAIQVIATASNQPQQTTSLQTIQVIANSIARQQAHQQVTSPQSQQVVQQTIQVIANMARQQSQQLQATEPQVIQQTANLQSVANVVRRQSQHATESQQLTQQADNLQSFAELARPQSQPATDQQHNIDLQSVADIVRRQSQLATDLHPQQVVQHSANLQSFAELARRHSTTEPQQVVQQTINLQAANIVRRQSQQTTEPQQGVQQTINSQSFADLARHQPATEPQQQANINLAPVARQQSQNTPDQQPMQQTVNLQNFSALSNQQQSQTSNSLTIQAIPRQQAPGVAQHTTNLQAIRAIANMARQQQQQQQQQQTTQPQLMQQVTDLQAIQAIANIARQSQQQATQGQPGAQQMHPTEPTPSA